MQSSGKWIREKNKIITEIKVTLETIRKIDAKPNQNRNKDIENVLGNITVPPKGRHEKRPQKSSSQGRGPHVQITSTAGSGVTISDRRKASNAIRKIHFYMKA